MTSAPHTALSAFTHSAWQVHVTLHSQHSHTRHDMCTSHCTLTAFTHSTWHVHLTLHSQHSHTRHDTCTCTLSVHTLGMTSAPHTALSAFTHSAWQVHLTLHSQRSHTRCDKCTSHCTLSTHTLGMTSAPHTALSAFTHSAWQVHLTLHSQRSHTRHDKCTSHCTLSVHTLGMTCAPHTALSVLTNTLKQCLKQQIRKPTVINWSCCPWALRVNTKTYCSNSSLSFFSFTNCSFFTLLQQCHNIRQYNKSTTMKPVMALCSYNELCHQNLQNTNTRHCSLQTGLRTTQ